MVDLRLNTESTLHERVEREAALAGIPVEEWVAAVCRERADELDALRACGDGPLSAAARALLPQSLRTLGMPARLANAVERRGARTVRDVVTCTRSELLSLQNVGRVGVDELEALLLRNGLRLGLPMQGRPLDSLC